MLWLPTQDSAKQCREGRRRPHSPSQRRAEDPVSCTQLDGLMHSHLHGCLKFLKLVRPDVVFQNDADGAIQLHDGLVKLTEFLLYRFLHRLSTSQKTYKPFVRGDGRISCSREQGEQASFRSPGKEACTCVMPTSGSMQEITHLQDSIRVVNIPRIRCLLWPCCSCKVRPGTARWKADRCIFTNNLLVVICSASCRGRIRSVAAALR